VDHLGVLFRGALLLPDQRPGVVEEVDRELALGRTVQI
jgi:hypothetical protein